MASEYALLAQLAPVIAKYQGSGKMFALYKSEGDSVGRELKLNDNVTVSLKYKSRHRASEA